MTIIVDKPRPKGWYEKEIARVMAQRQNLWDYAEKEVAKDPDKYNLDYLKQWEEGK